MKAYYKTVKHLTPPQSRQAQGSGSRHRAPALVEATWEEALTGLLSPKIANSSAKDSPTCFHAAPTEQSLDCFLSRRLLGPEEEETAEPLDTN